LTGEKGILHPGVLDCQMKMINVRVYPNSGKQEVIELDNTNYKVYLKSAPEHNKANIELLKILKRKFKKDIKIVSGLSSRKKIIGVKDGD